jgi:hypothetical protein
MHTWKQVASSCGTARGSSVSLPGRCLALVEGDLSKKVDWTSRASCMTRSVAGSMGTTKTSDLCSPSQDYGRSLGMSVSSCDDCRCQHVELVGENAETRTAVCLEMAWGRFQHLLQLDSLSCLQASCVLITKYQSTYVVQYIRPLTRNYIMESMCEFSSHRYIKNWLWIHIIAYGSILW